MWCGGAWIGGGAGASRLSYQAFGLSFGQYGCLLSAQWGLLRCSSARYLLLAGKHLIFGVFGFMRGDLRRFRAVLGIAVDSDEHEHPQYTERAAQIIVRV